MVPPDRVRKYDERDVRIRATRGTRARSKDRPTFTGTFPALVTQVDRGRITCETDDGLVVVAIKARDLGRKGVVVGDRAQLVGDSNQDPNSLARIVAISERSNVLTRTADDDDPTERIIVANLDLMVIVVACANPEPRSGLVDRCLAAAFDAGIEPVLLMTKADLASPESFLSSYRSLPLTVLSVQKGADLGPLRALLAGKTSVFIGHSGVGKSTLVNALIPAAMRATGEVNEVTGRGRHTSSSAVALRLPTGGWLIDTPGVRSFGLAHLNPERIIAAFDDIVEVISQCPRGCDHESDECALTAWAASDSAHAERVDSLRRLLASPRQSY
ncbi:MAG TPA: ribosome small subunit-dependent GTPase A [Candidatus Nanopelagicaceae bacterium]|nr:ribosome small subunit-dependent GTPase A [Candidatus Nanopelagicaceae bacterium]